MDFVKCYALMFFALESKLDDEEFLKSGGMTFARRKALKKVAINDEAAEHTLHLVLDFIQKFFQLARLDEIGDIVVGMKALA